MLTPPTLTHTFQCLQGLWQLQRVITGFGTFRGDVIIQELEPALIHYAESGVLTNTDGQSFKAHRSYVYELSPLSLNVYFDETPRRLFHNLTLSRDSHGTGLIGVGTHMCLDDFYITHYHIENENNFHIRHTVEGPKKSYQILSDYVRL